MTLIGTGFTVVFFLLLFFTPITDHNFIRDLFLGAERGPGGKIVKGYLVERLIFQGLTTLVWAFSAATVILKVMRNKRERGMLDEDTIPESLDFLNKEQCIEVYERIKSRPDLTESLGLTRVCRVLGMWINTTDFERTAQFAREQADLDAMASDSSYRRNRLFIWAMPLLGFVGTVFGVAAGISGFAAFLSGSNVTPEQIKEQVGKITEGLAVAFYCTLLGLVTAGLAAFPSLMAERNEEEVLSEIEEYVQGRMISRMPSGEKEERKLAEDIAAAVRSGMEGAQMQQKFPIEELAQAIDAGFRRLPNPDRYEEVFLRAISKAGDLINQKYDEFAQNYERRVGELGSQLGGKLEGVANSFSSGTQRLAQQLGEQSQRMGQALTEMESRQSDRMDGIIDEMKRLATQMPEEFRKAQERYLELQAKTEQKTTDRFEELTEQITTAGKEQSEQFAEAHEKYLDAINDLDKKEIARWEKMVADFNKLAAQLGDSFKQAVSTMDSASARYSERIQASVESLNEQLESIQRIGTEIDKVLRTTQSVETTLRQVGSSDEFRQTLANLRTHLSASDELLKQLSRPRKVVFQESRVEE
jgi:vacuolar-type H+-ATPase subunit D/Vma8